MYQQQGVRLMIPGRNSVSPSTMPRMMALICRRSYYPSGNWQTQVPDGTIGMLFRLTPKPGQWAKCGVRAHTSIKMQHQCGKAWLNFRWCFRVGSFFSPALGVALRSVFPRFFFFFGYSHKSITAFMLTIFSSSVVSALSLLLRAVALFREFDNGIGVRTLEDASGSAARSSLRLNPAQPRRAGRRGLSAGARAPPSFADVPRRNQRRAPEWTHALLPRESGHRFEVRPPRPPGFNGTRFFGRRRSADPGCVLERFYQRLVRIGTCRWVGVRPTWGHIRRVRLRARSLSFYHSGLLSDGWSATLKWLAGDALAR